MAILIATYDCYIKERIQNTCFLYLDCNYRAHHKCIQSVGRVCAHVIASESTKPQLDISPEIGLSVQLYKCAECAVSLRCSKFSNHTTF